MRALLVTLILATAAGASAQTSTDADTDAARHRYAAGVQAYDRGDYEQALVEFEAAKQAKPLPDLEFNIARCHDRLGHFQAAADAYDRYLAAKPNAPDAGEVRRRVEQLRARIAQPSAPAPTAPVPTAPAPAAPHRLRLAAWVTAGIAVALAGAGTGAYLSVYSDYNARKSACAGACDPTTLHDLSSRVDVAVGVGAALWALAGAAAVVDVVLWIMDGRQHERRVAWSPSSLAVRF